MTQQQQRPDRRPTVGGIPLWSGPRESWAYFTSWWFNYVALGVTVGLFALMLVPGAPIDTLPLVLQVVAFASLIPMLRHMSQYHRERSSKRGRGGGKKQS